MTATKKQCRRCRETKPADAFTADDRAKDGLQSYCRECSNAAAKKSRESRPRAPRPDTDTGNYFTPRGRRMP